MRHECSRTPAPAPTRSLLAHRSLTKNREDQFSRRCRPALPVENERAKQRCRRAFPRPSSDGVVPVTRRRSVGLIFEITCPYQTVYRIDTTPFRIGKIGGLVAALLQSGRFPQHFATDPAQIGQRSTGGRDRIEAILDYPAERSTDGVGLITAQNGNGAGAWVDIGRSKTHRHNREQVVALFTKVDAGTLIFPNSCDDFQPACAVYVVLRMRLLPAKRLVGGVMLADLLRRRGRIRAGIDDRLHCQTARVNHGGRGRCLAGREYQCRGEHHELCAHGRFAP